MKTRNPIPRAVLAAACVLSLLGCTNTPSAPSSDSTPPVLTWFIHNETTGDSSSISGDGHINATVNDTFSITLKVEDPQGVKLIQLGGFFTQVCRGGPPEFPASTVSGGLGTDSQPLSPDASGHVLPAIILIRQVAPDTGCPPGKNLAGYDATLDGLGNNYFAGSTAVRLIVSFTP